MALSALRSWFSSRPTSDRKRARARLGVDLLEARAVPATLLVNDNWYIVHDTGPAGLSAGDKVDNRNDAGAARVSGTFGTNAFSDINAAVDAASSGDTVRVLQGTYTGTVTVDKSLTLLGANANVSAGLKPGMRHAESVIDGAVEISASNVTLNGLKIINGATVLGELAGVYLTAGATNVTISNNIIAGAGSGRGILSTLNGGNDNLTIANNDIGHWTTGVFNQSNDGVKILSNRIHDNVAGVGNDFVNNLLIRGNTFVRNDEAVGVNESTDVRINLNNLANNTVAVHNYGGDTVDASFNYWGTTNQAAIQALVVGDVTTSNPLRAPVTLTTRLFTSGNNSLVLDTATGAFTLTLANGRTFTGRVELHNGRIELHVHDRNFQVQLHGSLSGGLVLDVHQGKNRTRVTLTDPESQPRPVHTHHHGDDDDHDDDRDDDHDDDRD